MRNAVLLRSVDVLTHVDTTLLNVIKNVFLVHTYHSYWRVAPNTHKPRNRIARNNIRTCASTIHTCFSNRKPQKQTETVFVAAKTNYNQLARAIAWGNLSPATWLSMMGPHRDLQQKLIHIDKPWWALTCRVPKTIATDSYINIVSTVTSETLKLTSITKMVVVGGTGERLLQRCFAGELRCWFHIASTIWRRKTSLDLQKLSTC